MAVVFFRADGTPAAYAGGSHSEPIPSPAEPFPNEPGDMPPADPQPVVSEPAPDPEPQPDDPGAQPPDGDPVHEAALESVLQTFQISRHQAATIDLLCGLGQMVNSTTLAIRAMHAEDLRVMIAVNRVLIFSLQDLVAALQAKLPPAH